MTSSTSPFSGTRTTRRVAAAVATTAVALSVAGLAAAPAQSAPDASCPDAFPVDQLVRDQAVTGLTVTHGTDPEQFTGKVLGVVNNGIAPGLPMIMVDVTSANVADIGIWEGMSGSPVYAEDGRLIGAVAYGLSAGPSEVAGVTPAADMQELLTQTPASDAAPLAGRVTLPRAMAQRVVASGAATSAEVSGGFTRLRLPFGISGLATAERRDQLAKALGVADVHTMAAGSASTSDTPIPIVAGGNLAAAVSYGDITTAGVGTATAVCGTQVVAFGHPMNFSGDSTMSLHGADAVYVQKDPTFAPFKMANLGAPVGTITGDHLAGIAGVVGPLPATSGVTSDVTVGAKHRVGSTTINVRAAVPDIALANLIAGQDRELDSVGKGSGTMSYVVDFTRADGTHQELTRSDVYADPADISYGDVGDLADLLYTLGYSGLEDVTIDSVHTTSSLSHTYQHYTLKKVQIRRYHTWVTLDPNRTLQLREGSNPLFRITLTSPTLGTRTVATKVSVPLHAARKLGVLQVFGGNTGGGQSDGSGSSGSTGDVYAEGMSSADAAGSTEPTLDDLLAQLQAAPHNDEAVADMTWFNQAGDQTNHRVGKVSAGQVVDGSIAFTIRGVRHIR